MNRYLRDYLVGVKSANVSGFEHLNTLMVRDRLFEQNKELTPEERDELLKADYQLIEQAPIILTELEQITSLEYERKQRDALSERWWWYLDVIVHLPFSIQLPTSDRYAQSIV